MSPPVEKRQPYEPNRTCERCRALKIRCQRSESASSHTCLRCARLDIECVYALPAKRKPRKRTDTKVAELEKEVRALSSILRKAHRSLASSPSPDPNLPQVGLSTPPEPSVSQPLESATPYSNPSDDSEHDSLADVIGSGLVSYQVACKMFNYFVASVMGRFPVVSVSCDECVDRLRQTRPLFLLAILATASTFVEPKLSAKMHDKLASVLALRSMVDGSPSLDLLQALLVATVWYFPGRCFDQLKYQQYSHMIAGVASQIGIERRRTASPRSGSSQSAPLLDYSHLSSDVIIDPSETNEIEVQRTLVSCFVLCSGISRSLHRPSNYPFTKFMGDCLENLEASPFATNRDKLLVQWVQLQRIMTDSSAALGVDDPSVSIDISEPRIQHTVMIYNAKLDAWQSKSITQPDDILLRFVFHCNKIALHEVAMYSDHHPDEFKPPYSIDTISKPVCGQVEWTAAHIQSLSVCFSNACIALDIFLDMCPELVRTGPDISFVRMIYCVVVVVKLSVSSDSQDCAMTSGLWSMQERPFRHVVSYIDRIVPLLKTAAEGGRSPIASKFGFILLHIKDWIIGRGKDGMTSPPDDHVLEPLRGLDFEEKRANHISSGSPTSINQNAAESATSEERQSDNLSDFIESKHDAQKVPLTISQRFPGFDLNWDFASMPDFGLELQSPSTYFIPGDFDFNVQESDLSSRVD